MGCVRLPPQNGGFELPYQQTAGIAHNRLIRRNGIPFIIEAGILRHSLAILMTLSHLARFACYASNIPGTQDEPLGFASLVSAARVMDEILTPIPIDLKRMG